MTLLLLTRCWTSQSVKVVTTSLQRRQNGSIIQLYIQEKRKVTSDILSGLSKDPGNLSRDSPSALSEFNRPQQATKSGHQSALLPPRAHLQRNASNHSAHYAGLPLSHTGWGKSQCNIIYWAFPGSSRLKQPALASSPQLSISPDVGNQPLAVFSVVHGFDVHCCGLNTRFILQKKNLVCKRTWSTPGIWFQPPSAPVTHCSWYLG